MNLNDSIFYKAEQSSDYIWCDNSTKNLNALKLDEWDINNYESAEILIVDWTTECLFQNLNSIDLISFMILFCS